MSENQDQELEEPTTPETPVDPNVGSESAPELDGTPESSQGEAAPQEDSTEVAA